MSAHKLISPSRLSLKVKGFYLFYFLAFGSFSPYFMLHLEKLGFKGSELGIIIGISPIVMLIASPFWGMLTDSKHIHNKVLFATTFCVIPIMWLISRADTLSELIILQAVLSFFSSAMMPLVDSFTMSMLGKEKNRYGEFRLWGAIGWGLSAPLFGALVHNYGTWVIFPGYIGFIALNLFLMRNLPHVHVKTKHSTTRNVIKLIRSSQWQIFTVSIFFIGIAAAIIANYIVIHLSKLPGNQWVAFFGGSEGLFGWSLAVATLSEIPIYILAPRIIKRYGSGTLVGISFFVYIVRCFAYAELGNPMWILALQLMHGPSFSALWASGVAYTQEHAPKGLSATAQSLFNLAYMGVGSAAGNYLGGFLYEKIGLLQTFRISGLIATFSLFLLIACTRVNNYRRRGRTSETNLKAH